MKTMLLVSLKSEEAILKVIEPSIFHLNSFIHMRSRRAVTLMLSKYDQVKIWQIFTKSLLTTTFKKIVHSIGMRRL
jgi:hypothetical protein